MNSHRGFGQCALLSSLCEIICSVVTRREEIATKEPSNPIAQDVKKCLQSAIANAENNHNLDVDELIVAKAYVGKNLIMKRGRPRARGRFGKIIKPFSELTITVRQVEEQA